MRTWIVLAVVTAVVGCEQGGVRLVGTNPQIDTGFGNGTGAGSAGICDEVNTAWLCTAYSGSGWTESQASADCPVYHVPGGTCPSTTLGFCVSDEGLATETTRVFYEPGYVLNNVPGLQSDCEAAGGAWY